MTDDDLTSLRRQVLKAGLTGSIVATAGCINNTNVETDSPDSDDQSEDGGEENADQDDGESQGPNIASAELSFEYSSADQQVTIEFAGGADIKAGNVRVQQGSETQVSWAELGSTTANPDQNIRPGATAILGENILNWGQPIAEDDLVRIVYTGGETPATLERYSPPESTDSESTVPASISGFTLESSGEQQLQISFDSTKQLETIEVDISGAESATLARTEFTENASGDGIFTYSASYEASSDGSYTATVAQAEDTDGTNALNGENISDTASINTQEQPSDTTPPSISAFSIANPSEQQLRVSFESNEELAAVQVSITGPESAILSESDFSETEPDSETYTYEGTYQASSDGEFTATLEEATDQNENDGSNGQSATLSVQTTDETIIDDFDYEADKLGSNGWTVNGDFSTESSQLTANSRSSYVLYRSLKPSFSGTWEFDGIQNNSEGRGLYIEFVRDPTANNLTGYSFVIQQLPDGIGNDFDGTNVDLYRLNGEADGEHLMNPSYDHDGGIHNYRLEVKEGMFELYIDGSKIDEATDNIYSDLSHIRLAFDGAEQYIDKIAKID